VFMEKPPGFTLQETQELADLACQRSTWGMVGFMKRFAPPTWLQLWILPVNISGS